MLLRDIAKQWGAKKVLGRMPCACNALRIEQRSFTSCMWHSTRWARGLKACLKNALLNSSYNVLSWAILFQSNSFIVHHIHLQSHIVFSLCQSMPWVYKKCTIIFNHVMYFYEKKHCVCKVEEDTIYKEK